MSIDPRCRPKRGKVNLYPGNPYEYDGVTDRRGRIKKTLEDIYRTIPSVRSITILRKPTVMWNKIYIEIDYHEEEQLGCPNRQ